MEVSQAILRVLFGVPVVMVGVEEVVSVQSRTVAQQLQDEREETFHLAKLEVVV